MKNLKLEVGKTYLNRKGKTVKIVGETGNETFPFGGDDYQSYTLDGRLWAYGSESHLDLSKSLNCFNGKEKVKH